MTRSECSQILVGESDPGDPATCPLSTRDNHLILNELFSPSTLYVSFKQASGLP